jgi:hypothetical protein
MDLDKTMWEIAERADAKAAADFSDRFPNLADAMQSRMKLVSGMKGVRKAITPSFIPGFTPRFLYKPKPKWRRYAPAALSIGALAAASYYVTQNLLTPLPDASAFRGPEVVAPARHIDLRPPANVPPNYNADAGPVPYKNQPSAGVSAEPVRMRLTQVHLVDAIKAIGHRYGLTVDMPEDFPDPVVDVDLVGTDAMTFLTQLGHDQGFTAYDEGKNHLLIVPARDTIH